MNKVTNEVKCKSCPNLEKQGRGTNMTEEEIKELAQRMNKEIDVPFISEMGEEAILEFIIRKVDSFLCENLPNEFYALIRSMDNGISDEEAKHLIKRLTKLANKYIDIPVIPEIVEGQIIKLVVAMFINAARRKCEIFAR